jgi:hypothetical protein
MWLFLVSILLPRIAGFLLRTCLSILNAERKRMQLFFAGRLYADIGP